MLQIQNEQFYDALNLYEKALEIDPQCEDAWLQLALLYDDFLNDKSNAVVAYREYVAIARNEATKERAQRWLAAAEADLNADHGAAPEATIQNSHEVAKALEQRERQFKLLRSEMVNRYEGELEELRQELMNAQERVATLETENTMFRGRDPNGDVADLLDRIASNEQVIALLQMQVEQAMEDADEVYRGKAAMQALVTNLQTELRDARAQVGHADDLAESNALLMAECDLRLNRLRALEQQRNTLQLELREVRERAAEEPAVATLVVTTEVAEVAAATVVTQTQTVASTDVVEALAATSNVLTKLEDQVASHAAERDNYVGILESLKQVVSDRDQELAELRQQLDELQDVGQVSLELKQVQALLEQEKEARARNDKLLYERTMQYKRLVQSYDALRTQYADEVQQRQRLGEYLARVQQEISGTPVSTRPVAQAGIVPTPTPAATRSTRYAVNTGSTTTPAPSPTPQLTSRTQSTTREPEQIRAISLIRETGLQPLSAKVEGRFYKVQKGDSLVRIARAFYGDPAKWTLIYNENRSILDRPNSLRIGQTLKIP